MHRLLPTLIEGLIALIPPIFELDGVAEDAGYPRSRHTPAAAAYSSLLKGRATAAIMADNRPALVMFFVTVTHFLGRSKFDAKWGQI